MSGTRTHILESILDVPYGGEVRLIHDDFLPGNLLVDPLSIDRRYTHVSGQRVAQIGSPDWLDETGVNG